MKRIKNKLGIIGLSILSLSSLTVLNSCSHDDDVTISDPRRFTKADVQSYEDLFTIFWKTMDQQYNYFFEQKEQGGMDWDAIYEEYHPKFAALKTFGRPNEDDAQIHADYLKADSYFEEIIDPIIDRHFMVQIRLPATNKGVGRNVTYWGGMLDTTVPSVYPFEKKFGYMLNKVNKDAFIANNPQIGVIAGNLESNPDIYYFSFNKFNVTSSLSIMLEDNYLNPGSGNGLVLTPEDINSNELLNQIQDQELRENIKKITLDMLQAYNSFSNTEAFQVFLGEARKFNSTEIVSDELLLATQNLAIAYNALPKYNSASAYGPYFNAATSAYVNQFVGLMGNSVNFGFRFPDLVNGINQVLGRGAFYQKFLNPLHKGEIKKLIIDLRSNGGGAVIDARFLSDRFITKEAVFAYQRTREGNGRFNYTPWVEAVAKPHDFGIPSNIPIAILTDKGSVSMSEITTLMLKSQGNQVVSVGDYTLGGTAGLGANDDFNGGTRDEIAGGIFTFYMPLLAMKDANGVVIEGVGVKPDLPVSPLTDEERQQMASPNFEDRVLNEAIKHLSSK